MRAEGEHMETRFIKAIESFAKEFGEMNRINERKHNFEVVKFLLVNQNKGTWERNPELASVLSKYINKI